MIYIVITLLVLGAITEAADIGAQYAAMQAVNNAMDDAMKEYTEKTRGNRDSDVLAAFWSRR